MNKEVYLSSNFNERYFIKAKRNSFRNIIKTSLKLNFYEYLGEKELSKLRAYET